MENLRQFLEPLLKPIADWFGSFGIPEPIVHWGHPLMMGIVVLVMGSFVGLTGWRGRVVADKDDAIQSRSEHRKLAPWMFLFITLGYTGGVLSLVMQQQPIFESWHFWTGSLAVGLLGLNGAISLLGFGRKQGLQFRTIHAYLGSVALCLLFLHGLLGLKLGLSL